MSVSLVRIAFKFVILITDEEKKKTKVWAKFLANICFQGPVFGYKIFFAIFFTCGI